MSNRWRKVENHMPEINSKFCETDCVTCLEENGYPFTGWYNKLTDTWYNADHNTSNIGREVVWWRPIMKLPK